MLERQLRVRRGIVTNLFCAVVVDMNLETHQVERFLQRLHIDFGSFKLLSQVIDDHGMAQERQFHWVGSILKMYTTILQHVTSLQSK